MSSIGSVSLNTEACERLSTSFCEDSKRLQYREVPSLRLIPENDSSVLFTSATINRFKPQLTQTIAHRQFVVQECLRTQNKATFYSNEDIEYASYFHMCGAIAPPGEAGEVFQEAIAFITANAIPANSQILVRTSSRHPKLDFIPDNNSQLIKYELDAQAPAYYEWSYGRPGLNGEGATFAVNEAGIGWRDIGNIVLMSLEGDPVAVEWGFGVETFLSRISALGHPVRAHAVGDVLPTNTGEEIKFADTLATTAEMIVNNIKPGSQKQAFILKEYLKGLYFLATEQGISIPDVLTSIKEYIISTRSECSEVQVESLEPWLMRHEDRINEFCRRVSRLAIKHSSEGVYEATHKDNYWRSELGINPQHAKKLLQETLGE